MVKNLPTRPAMAQEDRAISSVSNSNSNGSPTSRSSNFSAGGVFRTMVLAMAFTLATNHLLPRNNSGGLSQYSVLNMDSPIRGGRSLSVEEAGPTSNVATNTVITTTNNNDDYQLAYYQSYGFFDDIPSKDWKMFQERYRTRQNHADPNRPNPNPKHMPSLFYMSNYDPVFSCAHERRVGGVGDGPKWVCDVHRLETVARERAQKATTSVSANGNGNTTPQQQTKCLIYSVGSAGKYEWEEALAKSFLKEGQTTQQSVCEIHVFDYTKDYTKKGHAEDLNIHFHQWGLKSSYDDSLPKAFNLKQPELDRLFTIPEMMEKLGHTNHVIDIFKVDCEFCEWFAYKDWLEPQLDIRQILIETHNLPTALPEPNKNKGGQWFPVSTSIKPADFFDDMEKAGFAMYSKEPNIHPQAQGNGVEFAYIKLHPDFFQGVVASA